MRLNGRKEIMAYLGRSSCNRDGWRKIRQIYGRVIWRLPGSGHVWSLTEELSGLDRERCHTVAETMDGGGVGAAVGGYPRDLAKRLSRYIKRPGGG